MKEKYHMFVYAYLILTLVLAFTVMSLETLGLFISALACPFLSFWAGSGLKGSIYNGGKYKVVGVIMAITFMLPALVWINYTGYWISYRSVEISGTLWVVLGFLISFFGTKRKNTFYAK